MFALGRVAALLALCPPALGCEPAQPARASTEPAPAAPIKVVQASATRLAIAAGELRAGSLPGSAGRDPATEADLAAIALGAFEIDRKPRGTTRDAQSANTACEAGGARLCHELEWEQACVRAGAEALEVRALEWAAGAGRETASVARGPAQGGPVRCAARTFIEQGAAPAEGLAYRCCTGEAIEAHYPAPAADLAVIAPLERSPAELASALGALQQLGERARGFVPYETSDIDAALRRGKRSRDGISAWKLMPATFIWRPTRGEELHVVSGRAGERGVLALLYPLADGSYAHAASLVLDECDTSIAIGFRDSTPNELLWTTCYGCPAEGGTIRYVAGGRPTIDFH